MKIIILCILFSFSLRAREIYNTDFSINPYTGNPTHFLMNSYGNVVDLTDHIYLRRKAQEFNITLSRNQYAKNHFTVNFSSSDSKETYEECMVTETHYLPTSLLRAISGYYSWDKCLRRDIFFKYIVKSIYLDFSSLPTLEENQLHRFVIKVIKLNKFDHKYKFSITSSDYYVQNSISSNTGRTLIKFKSLNMPSYAEINEDQFIFKPIQK